MRVAINEDGEIIWMHRDENFEAGHDNELVIDDKMEWPTEARENSLPKIKIGKEKEITHYYLREKRNNPPNELNDRPGGSEWASISTDKIGVVFEEVSKS